jgi:hypothetical protein
MRKKAVRVEGPSPGLFGSVVNVGDEVAVVTTCTGVTNVQRGKYLGYIQSSGNAQVEVETVLSLMTLPDGTKFNWNKHYNPATWDDVRKTVTHKTIQATRITTLQRNRMVLLNK